jgi:hypothetical protein
VTEPVGLADPSMEREDWLPSRPAEAAKGEPGEGRAVDAKGGDRVEVVECEFVRRRTAGRKSGCCLRDFSGPSRGK